MVILDTNIIIEHLRLKSGQTSRLANFVAKHPKDTLALSMVSLQELYEGRSTRDPAKEKDLLATIAPLKILPYTYEVAKLAGELARDHKDPVELADAAIAATAIINTHKLFTLNTKDFLHFPGLELLKTSEEF